MLTINITQNIKYLRWYKKETSFYNYSKNKFKRLLTKSSSETSLLEYIIITNCTVSLFKIKIVATDIYRLIIDKMLNVIKSIIDLKIS